MDNSDGMNVARPDDSEHVKENAEQGIRAGMWTRLWDVLRPRIPDVLVVYGVSTSFVIGPILAVILYNPAVWVSGLIAWLLACVLHHWVPYFSDDYQTSKKASRRSIGQVSKQTLSVRIRKRLTEPPARSTANPDGDLMEIRVRRGRTDPTGRH